jgi:glycogen operon protein
MLEFTRELVKIRQSHPSLTRRRFFFGRRVHGADVRDIVWLQPNGEEMADDEWGAGYVRCLGLLLNGEAMREWAEDGSLVSDVPLLMLLNAHHEAISFRLPPCAGYQAWQLMLDTAAPSVESVTRKARRVPVGKSLSVGGRSLVLMRVVDDE